jgi:hypothetical protein
LEDLDDGLGGLLKGVDDDDQGFEEGLDGMMKGNDVVGTSRQTRMVVMIDRGLPGDLTT